MKIDPILFQKANNNKRRKLANIRTKNTLVSQYQKMKNSGEIIDFKIKVVIKNRVQSAGIWVIPTIPAKDITISIGYIKD